MKNSFLTLLALFFMLSCNNNQNKKEDKNAIPRTNAPEINTSFGWLNTDKSHVLKDFRGKIVLLDFWTFGCINCQHILPNLKKLEEEFSQEFVIIGVHSAKFDTEKNTNTIRKAILKFGITHPVVNDADSKVWEQYAITGWPTLVLITPEGKISAQKSGESAPTYMREQILKLKKEFEGKINNTVFNFKLEEKQTKSVLNFPSKIIKDAQNNIWVADSGNNRILNIDQNGKILTTIGSGKQGFEDNDFSKTSFNEPHGIALKGDLLYIADAKNNAIRVANLATKTVKTIAGNGKMGYYAADSWGKEVLPNSPWDLLIDETKNIMYVASAGNHQILQLNLQNNQLTRFAGTGAEALLDGTLKESAFNQPSGLYKINDFLYIADTEASAIRKIDLKNGQVSTVFGRGLFIFGDKDGDLKTALMQHCVGISEKNGEIFVADTYNGKIKKINFQTNQLSTVVAGLNEPNDLFFIDDFMFISDTNNHHIIKINLKTNEKTTIL